MYAQLPLTEVEVGSVFLFGEHDGPVLCLASNGGLLLSGGADGCVRLWNLDSGVQLDWARVTGSAGQVTAVAFVGPLMVATGTEQGTVCMYDISTRRMEAVQRFVPDAGPVTSLAARITPTQAAQLATAAAPRTLDGGGVVAGPAGLPWRCPPEAKMVGKDTQLAIASSAGWLHVYTAAGVGEAAWQHCHAGAVDGTPHLSYSPDGNYLAVGSGSRGGRVSVLDASSMQVVHEQYFPPGGVGAGAGGSLLGAGFLPASAGGSALVAMQRGGSLAGGLRLRLYAAPAEELPSMIELILPLQQPNDPLEERESELAEGQDFLDWLERKAAAPLPAGASPSAGSRSPGATWTRPGGHATASPARPHASTAGPGSPFAPRPTSPLVPVRGSVADQPPTALSRSLADPWASPRSGAHGTSSAPRDSPARTWQAQRPNTQPAPRSWLTGLPPRPDFQPQPEPAAPPPAPLAAHCPGQARKPLAAASDAPKREDRLLLSGTLLPVTGISTNAADTDCGRHDAASDPEDADAPSTGRALAWEYGAASGPANWRGGDLSMGPELFRSFAPNITQGQGSVGSRHGGARGRGASGRGSGDVSASGSFRFQPVPRPHPQHLALHGSTAHQGPGPRSGAQGPTVRFLDPGMEAVDGSSPSPSPQPQEGEPENAEAPGGSSGDELAGSWGGRRYATLERTAYFGDELAAALRSTAADQLEAGEQRLDGLPQQGEADRKVLRPDSGPLAHSGRGIHVEAQERQQAERPDDQAEEEHLVPRGSTGLPRPQRPAHRPPPQQEFRRGPPHLHRRSSGDGQEPKHSREEEVTVPSVRSSIAVAACKPGLPLPPAGVPSSAELDTDAVWLPVGAEACAPVEDGGGEDGENGERHWAGWRNADLLAKGTGEATGAVKAADATRGAQGKGPSTRPALAPRQPPVLASARLQIMGDGAEAPPAATMNSTAGPQGVGQSGHDGTSARGSAASSFRGSIGPSGMPPPSLPQQHQHLEQQEPPEEVSERGEQPHEPEPVAPAWQSYHQRQQAYRGTVAAAQRYAAGNSQDESGDGDGDATPSHSVSASGGPSPAQSLLHSPAVLLGSPANSTTTRGSSAPHRVAPAAAIERRQAQRERALQPQRADTANGSSASNTAVGVPGSVEPVSAMRSGGGGGTAARQHLQHLRQQRQHQHLRRLKQPTTLSKPAVTGTKAAQGPRGRHGRSVDNGWDAVDIVADQPVVEDHSSSCLPLPPPEASASPWGAAGAVVTAAAALGDSDVSGSSYGPTCGAAQPRGPPTAPAFGSTALLLRRMQALEQVLAREVPAEPIVTRGAVQPGRGGAAGPRGAGPARDLAAAAAAAGVSEAAVEEAARRAATAAANVPPGVQLYHNLPAVDAKPQQPKVAKQLHAGWVASRQLKPEMGSLWRPEEQLAEISNTRGVALYVPPSPAEVASSLLRLHML